MSMCVAISSTLSVSQQAGQSIEPLRPRSRRCTRILASAGLLAWLLAAPQALSNPSSDEPETHKPLVVVLHGLGRTRISMWLFASRLEEAGFRVHRIGYRSLDRSPDEIIDTVSRRINECCANHAGGVHFVGHSLGGLLIRAYLQNNRVEALGRVVLIGTPNQGSELVDRFRDNGLLSLLGPTTAALGTDSASLPGRLPAPYYPVGVIAAVNPGEWNDHWLPGPDDGLISVDSTRLDGMSDFIEIESGHSRMRYNKDVARQAVEFLRTGRFFALDEEPP